MKQHRRLSYLAMAALVMLAVRSPASAAPMEKVLVVDVPAHGKPMAARTDSSGTIHVVFESPSGPHYARSRDDGKSLEAPILLVDSAARREGLEFTVWDMAVGPDGTVHVALGTNAWKLKLPKDEWGYFYTRLSPRKTEFDAIRNLNRRPSEGFSLAAGEHGEVAAVWMADKLFANLSDDGGATFGPVVDLDPRLDPCNCCTTCATYASDGRLAILYREETNNERDMHLGLWDPGTGKISKTRVSATGWKIDSCPMTYFSLTRSGDGWVAAWPTRGDIYFTRIGADGSLGTPREIKTSGSSGMRTGVLALPTRGGNTLIAWRKENRVGWQFYNERGQPQGIPHSVESQGSGVAATINRRGDVVLFR